MSRAAKVLLVLLRIAIGWHFLYEGVWKIASDRDGGQQYTSRHFVQASVARLRDSLGGVETPTPQVAAARLGAWQDEVIKHFKAQGNELSEEQKARLAAVCEKLADSLRESDGVVDIDWIFLHENVLKLAGEKDGRQYFTSEDYLRASAGPFRSAFRGLIPDADGLQRVTKASAEAEIDRRYEQIVRHFESRGHPLTLEQRTRLAGVRDRLRFSIAAQLDDPAFQARLADYRGLVQRVRADRSRVTAPFADERLTADRKRLDTIASELLAFVNEPLTELAIEAQRLETVDQMKAGPPPHPASQTRAVDFLIEWGLAAIGACLVLGLFTPVAAGAAAAQLAVFYFASPPWPGLPAATMGGHYMYVDRNLVEMLAALVLVAVPSGGWAGFDFWLARLWTRMKSRHPAQVEATAPVAAAQ